MLIMKGHGSISAMLLSVIGHHYILITSYLQRLLGSVF